MATARRTAVPVVYQTPKGTMFNGQAQDVLASDEFRPWRGRVQLLFTSPPFPLNREKKYGNLMGGAFAEWLAGFAQPFTDCLTPDGSIVIELGNGWEPRQPTMSTTSLKALLAFQEAAGLHLCQEFIGYNPAKLPTPAQWVTINRFRCKDAFTRFWWMSPTPYPKADNRRVLTGYSERMRKLLKSGSFNSGARPSAHHIVAKTFMVDNGGAIPPNVLVPPAGDEPHALLPVSNTASNSPYYRACKAKGLKPHPATMPEPLVEFFVRYLTDENDVVLDPFAGSNTTGSVAERLGRRWLAVEANPDYAAASELRFAA